MGMRSEVTPDDQLIAIVLGYRNQAHIADRVLPRVQVPTASFEYMYFDMAQNMTAIDTKVDRRSKPNEVDWKGERRASFVEDHALDAPVPNRDLMIDRANIRTLDIDARKQQQLASRLSAMREKRAADLAFTAANYPAANKATLSGTGQWSDYTNSDPLDAILDAIDAMIMRPNRMVIGHEAWTILRRHPKLTASLYPNGGNAASGAALATRQAMAELLELEEVLVGQSFLNTAKEGQTPTYSRAWGKHALFYFSDDTITDPEGTLTLGITAEWGEKIGGRIEDADMGARGGYRLRAGESVRELLLAPECGFLFSNVVA